MEEVEVDGAKEEEDAEDELGDLLLIEIRFQSALLFNCYQDDGADRQHHLHQDVGDYHGAVL